MVQCDGGEGWESSGLSVWKGCFKDLSIASGICEAVDPEMADVGDAREQETLKSKYVRANLAMQSVLFECGLKLEDDARRRCFFLIKYLYVSRRGW
jgi:hypothetical protein